MCLADNLKRLVTCQLQDVPVSLGRLIKLVLCFPYLAQPDCRQYRRKGIPGRPAESYRLCKGAAGAKARSPCSRYANPIVQLAVARKERLSGRRCSRARRDSASIFSTW